jgi:hypothetical protein
MHPDGAQSKTETVMERAALEVICASRLIAQFTPQALPTGAA